MIVRKSKKAGVLTQLLLFYALYFSTSELLAQSIDLIEGVYTEEQAAIGAELYVEHCSHCHDHEFFQNSFGAWQGMTVLDYWYRILGNMPADNPRSLGDEQYLSIVAWIIAVNGFPPGSEPLTPHNYLGRIRL